MNVTVPFVEESLLEEFLDSSVGPGNIWRVMEMDQLEDILKRTHLATKTKLRALDNFLAMDVGQLDGAESCKSMSIVSYTLFFSD